MAGINSLTSNGQNRPSISVQTIENGYTVTFNGYDSTGEYLFGTYYAKDSTEAADTVELLLGGE